MYFSFVRNLSIDSCCLCDHEYTIPNVLTLFVELGIVQNANGNIVPDGPYVVLGDAFMYMDAHSTLATGSRKLNICGVR